MADHGNFAQYQGQNPVDVEGFVPGYDVYQGTQTYDIIFERRRQPDNAGAHAFAWETYGLMLSSPIGAGTARRQQGMAPIWQKPMIVENNAVLTYGLPIISGEIYGQPLVDANGNLVNSIAPDISAFQAGWNNPSPNSATPYPIGNPFPQGY
jgi:hypothetical protein